jgi:hypothetical protein
MVPIANSANQAIWQVKAAPDVQGRMFALRGMIAQAITPLAYALAGPLAERFFEPWMAQGGALAGAFGGLVGVGAGRGAGLLLVVSGLSVILAVVLGLISPRVRLVEDELPDHVRVARENGQGLTG